MLSLMKVRESGTEGELMGSVVKEQYSPLYDSRSTATLAYSPSINYVSLHNGRRLSYEEFGSPSGQPLIYLHDGGSSRLEAAFFHRSARTAGYRIIAVDRPGIGFSDFYPVSCAKDFCEDLLQLADQLDIGEFSLMSLGAGGVYALHLAHDHAPRINSHLSLAGIPGNVFNESAGYSYVATCWNELTPAIIKCLVGIKHRFFPEQPEQSVKKFRDYLSSTDRRTLADPQVMKMLVDDYRETLRSGYKGVAQDLGICFRKLEFSLLDVAVPTVVWQGSADRLTRRADCEYMVSRLPRACFHRVPSRGHFFFVHHMDEIFSRLRASQATGAIAA